jgi:Fe-S cluster biogenesis protein NfuA
MRGACGTCPGALMTIKMVIEQTLKEDIPEVKEVVGV